MRFFQGTETERERFRQAYQQIDHMRAEAGTPVKQAAFLDYAIRCIGRELAAVTSTAPLYGEPVPDVSELLIPLICKDNRQAQEEELYGIKDLRLEKGPNAPGVIALLGTANLHMGDITTYCCVTFGAK